ncbi:hypothetical protein Vafri_14864 [Volvox africanus]|uniref:Uncharacterized protein n=1 Tax=Volvox africanus TaxID=51714 RepID=A0A8J4BEI9_9CHLO|nr:hypothetical protein Vafri_14864 [Volvox africanus]
MPWGLKSALSSPWTSVFSLLAMVHLCTLVLNVLIRLEDDAVPQGFRDAFPVNGSTFQRFGFIASHPHLTYRAVYNLKGGAVWITWNFYIIKARLVLACLSIMLNFRDKQADILLTLMQRLQAVVYLTCQCFLNPNSEPSPSAFWYLERSLAWNLLSHVLFPAGPLEVMYAVVSLLCLTVLTVSYVRLHFPIAERMPCILLREAGGNAVLLALEAWRWQYRRGAATRTVAEMAGSQAGQRRFADLCKPLASSKEANCRACKDQQTEARVGTGTILQPSQNQQYDHEDRQRWEVQQERRPHHPQQEQRIQQQLPNKRKCGVQQQERHEQQQQEVEQQQQQQQQQQQGYKPGDFRVPNLSPSQHYHHEDGCASRLEDSNCQQTSDVPPLNDFRANVAPVPDTGQDGDIHSSCGDAGPAAVTGRREVPPVTAVDIDIDGGSAVHASGVRPPASAGAPPVIASLMGALTANATCAGDGRNLRSLYAVPLRPLRDVIPIGTHERLAAAVVAAATCSTPVRSTIVAVSTTATIPTTLRAEPEAGRINESECSGPASAMAPAPFARPLDGSRSKEQNFRRLLPPAFQALRGTVTAATAGAGIDASSAPSLQCAPRYVAWSRLLSTRIKISGEGAQPELIPDGYRERIAAVVAAAGQQLEGVYVRRGCIELVVDVRRFRSPSMAIEEAPYQGAHIPVDKVTVPCELCSTHYGRGGLTRDNETISVQDIVRALQLPIEVIDDVMCNDQATMDGWQQGLAPDASSTAVGERRCGGAEGACNHGLALTACWLGGYVASIATGTHVHLHHPGGATAGAEPGAKAGCRTAPERPSRQNPPPGVSKFTPERRQSAAASGLEPESCVLSVRIADAKAPPVSTSRIAAITVVAAAAAAASSNRGPPCSSCPYSFSPLVYTSLCGYQLESSAVDASTSKSRQSPLELSVLAWSAGRQSLELSIRSRDRYLPVAHGPVTWLPAATAGESASSTCGGCLAVINVRVLELPSPPALLLVGVRDSTRNGSPVQGLAPLLLVDDQALQEELNHALCLDRPAGGEVTAFSEIKVATAGNNSGALPVELRELVLDLGGFLQNAAAKKAAAANAAAAAAAAQTASGGRGCGSGDADGSVSQVSVDEHRLHLLDLGMHILQWFMAAGGSQRWPLTVNRLRQELVSLKCGVTGAEAPAELVPKPHANKQAISGTDG